MKSQRRLRPVARIALLIGAAVTGLAVAAPAQGEPLWPGGPDIPGVPPLVLPPLAPPAPVVAPCTAEAARGCMRLSTNEAWLMDNGRVVYGPTPISHGRPGFRTRVGVFDVDFKREDHWSTMHHVWMKYAVFFDGDIATHIGPIEEESHGCIRMTPDGAREFFDYLSPGDIIEVVP
ncbi:L,D-transpeptidase [Nocardia bhagyanarayanae]|uniref:L,D-transpeptidase-like protein n=1 Tax=Nocardia bhagyanarayanae TaxID=1215925 RepID=A0A543FF03_9NOCA|nr:L,D-transpeptidase [Nocardia bhagyanarayanae]TQM32448.1 L,D-transpeptidase-like protein [Nocardia bhagyanarayanae]